MDTAEKLAKAYEDLQHLKMEPIRSNMEILLTALIVMREAYQKLREAEEAKHVADQVENKND